MASQLIFRRSPRLIATSMRGGQPGTQQPESSSRVMNTTRSVLRVAQCDMYRQENNDKHGTARRGCMPARLAMAHAGPRIRNSSLILLSLGCVFE